MRIKVGYMEVLKRILKEYSKKQMLRFDVFDKRKGNMVVLHIPCA